MAGPESLRKSKAGRRPPLESFYPYLLAIFIGYTIADVMILNYRDLMLPQEAPPTRPAMPLQPPASSRGAYNTITSRNIFSSDGKVPEALKAEGSGGSEEGKDQESAPVLSSLPLNLVGTIVFVNPERSIATIEIKGKSLVQAFSVGNEIDSVARVEKVERERVILRNLNNNRLEFIEMKSASKLAFKSGGIQLPTAKASGDVMQVAPNKFKLKRSNVLKYTNNLNDVLQQARAVPNRDPKTGEITCFRMLDIQPGSIYEQLGIQKMDCISGVNGTKINSPQQALEVYNALKNASKISIDFERGGTPSNHEYDIE